TALTFRPALNSCLPVSDGNKDGSKFVFTAAKPALAATPLGVLLVGDKEEDFFLIREILERNRSLLAADLDHATSIAEARTMMLAKSYDLVLFEHDTGSVEAVGLLAE